MPFGALVLIVPVAAFVAIAWWVRRSRVGEATEPAEARPGSEPIRGRVSLLTEAIVYVGAILVLAGAGTAIGQNWEDFGDGTRLAILGSAAIVFLGVGALTRSSSEPAFRRLTAVTWALAVAACAGAIAVVNDASDTSPETAFLTIATGSTALAVVLWAFNRRAIQHAVVFIGILVSAASILVMLIHEPEPWLVAIVLWAIAVAWAAAGWTRLLPPWWMAVSLGGLTALIVPAAVDVEWARFALGIGTAGGVMALAVAGRFTPGVPLGAVAMVGYVVGAVTHYFGDTIGVPAALALTGMLILILAAVAARLIRITRPRPRPGVGGDADARSVGEARGPGEAEGDEAA